MCLSPYIQTTREKQLCVLLAFGRSLTPDLDREAVLARIVEAARSLTGARYVEADALLVLLADGTDLRIAAYAGNTSLDPAAGVPIAGSVSGRALMTQRPQRVSDVRAELVVRSGGAEMPGARSALVVPPVFRGVALGVLSALDHLGRRPTFDVGDERALRAFAVGAATAVSAARVFEAACLRDSLAGVEAERKRWARELHDETLQGLGAIKLALAAAVRAGPYGSLAGVRDAITLLDGEIAGLRSTIADLRPAALDRLGLEPALRSLGARAADRGGLGIEMSFDLGGARLTPGVESAVYRIAQEALTNVVRHAHARTASLTLTCDGDTVRLRVTDDGRGVVGEPTDGFGLLGMQERAALAGGAVLVETAGPEGSGTRVQLTLPIPAGPLTSP